MNFLEAAMGKLPSEKILEKSTDPRFIRFLRLTNFLRFLFFPISLSLLLAFLFLVGARIALGMIAKVFDILFSAFNDSTWIDMKWLGITKEDYISELDKISESNNGN